MKYLILFYRSSHIEEEKVEVLADGRYNRCITEQELRLYAHACNLIC